MSNAKERALEKYPILKTELGDLNNLPRIGFIEGYHQAEKDLELCWEDLKLLDKIFMNEKIMSGLILEKKEYEEILKRFQDYKERN